MSLAKKSKLKKKKKRCKLNETFFTFALSKIRISLDASSCLLFNSIQCPKISVSVREYGTYIYIHLYTYIHIYKLGNFFYCFIFLFFILLLYFHLYYLLKTSRVYSILSTLGGKGHLY